MDADPAGNSILFNLLLLLFFTLLNAFFAGAEMAVVSVNRIRRSFFRRFRLRSHLRDFIRRHRQRRGFRLFWRSHLRLQAFRTVRRLLTMG